MLVPDVEKFPGHIACSSLSRSEIVIPLLYKLQLWGVLDVDSEELNTFDETDQLYLEKLAAFLSAQHGEEQIRQLQNQEH
jgi:GAF domain-containing protein